MKLLASLLCLFTFTIASYTALANTKISKIQGNPIGKRNNYTINSAKAQTATITCRFSNEGKTPARIAVWTSPKQIKPYATINLPKTTLKTKPSTVTQSYQLTLKKSWWCRINTAGNQSALPYCAYFSISDETVVRYNPFATWDSTTRSKKTYYICKLAKKPQGIYFFYFKK